MVWANHEDFSGILPCEGGMHFLICTFSAIGYLYGDAGLSQMLTDSGVFAPGTVRNILLGKDFDRAMYAMKLVDEVLHCRFFVQFNKWCEENHKTLPESIINELEDIEKYFSDLEEDNCTSFNDLLTIFMADISSKLQPMIDEFVEIGCNTSPTFKFWYEFLSSVTCPFKLFVSSTRNPNWEVHQASKLQILPLLFVANRTNYSRYMPVMLLMMNK